jgi:hypothetical protein
MTVKMRTAKNKKASGRGHTLKWSLALAFATMNPRRASWLILRRVSGDGCCLIQLSDYSGPARAPRILSSRSITAKVIRTPFGSRFELAELSDFAPRGHPRFAVSGTANVSP